MVRGRLKRFGFENNKNPPTHPKIVKTKLSAVAPSMSGDKRGQFMALYLPILTLFMCFLVATMYWVQNSKLDNHMVSPVKVLELGDDKDVFEMAEGEWICSAYKKSGKDEGKFAEEFCKLFSASDRTSFIFEKAVDEAGDDKSGFFVGQSKKGERENFCKSNYKFDFSQTKEELGISFSAMKRVERLEALDVGKINFAVDFEYVYKKEEVVDLGDC